MLSSFSHYSSVGGACLLPDYPAERLFDKLIVAGGHPSSEEGKNDGQVVGKCAFNESHTFTELGTFAAENLYDVGRYTL